VYRDGTAVGTTNGTGALVVSIPPDARESMTLRVEKDDLEATKRVTLGDLSLSVEAGTVLTLPGQSATIHVTAGGTPLEGVSVTQDGEYIGKTNSDGKIQTALPYADREQFGATVYGESLDGSTGSMYLHTVLLLGLLLATLGGAVGLARRRGVTASSVSHRIRALGGLLARNALAALLILTEGVDSIKRHLSSTLRQLQAGIGAFLTRIRQRVSALSLEALRNRIAQIDIPGWLGRSSEEPAPSSTAEPATTDTVGAATAGPDGPGRLSVRAAFRTLAASISAGQWRSMTPGEVCRQAIAEGYPQSSVETLTRAFRDVEYDGRDPASGPESRAETAVSQLEATEADDR